MPEAWIIRAARRVERLLRLDGQPLSQRANTMVQRHRIRKWNRDA